MHKPSDRTGWFGGKHAVAAADAVWVCQCTISLPSRHGSEPPAWQGGTRTRETQQYWSGVGPTFSKKKRQEPKEIVWTCFDSTVNEGAGSRGEGNYQVSPCCTSQWVLGRTGNVRTRPVRMVIEFTSCWQSSLTGGSVPSSAHTVVPARRENATFSILYPRERRMWRAHRTHHRRPLRLASGLGRR